MKQQFLQKIKIDPKGALRDFWTIQPEDIDYNAHLEIIDDKPYIARFLTIDDEDYLVDREELVEPELV